MAGLPGTLNLDYYFGDSLNFQVTWKDSAGAAKDITGYSAAMSVRTQSGEKLLSLASGSGITVTGASGLVAVDATPTQMVGPDSKLREGETFYYDLQVKSGDGSILKTLAVGTFKVTRQHTNA